MGGRVGLVYLENFKLRVDLDEFCATGGGFDTEQLCEERAGVERDTKIKTLNASQKQNAIFGVLSY